jgi:hypothetical protein
MPLRAARRGWPLPLKIAAVCVCFFVVSVEAGDRHGMAPAAVPAPTTRRSVRRPVRAREMLRSSPMPPYDLSGEQGIGFWRGPTASRKRDRPSP